MLADCSAVTTGGLEQLSGLVGLHHLALLRCPRVGDKGMTLLHCLTSLTYLALTGCCKVSACTSSPSWPSLCVGCEVSKKMTAAELVWTASRPRDLLCL